MSKDIIQKKEEKLYSRNFKRFGLDMNPVVSLGTGFFIIIFALIAMLNLEKASIVFEDIKAIITSYFDWLFILASIFFIIVCAFLAFSKYGNVVIGGVHSEPKYSNFSWYSMLISAGMGIGLMFWAVGEPLYHLYSNPPIYSSDFPEQTAMATTFFHWGLHPWGIYALIALALAFFAYNKKLPLSLRSVFYPLFKDRVFGIIGDLIDILAVVACLFGLATSLGLGVQQINSGFTYLFGLPTSVNIQVLLIIIITAIATLSVISGVDKGVRVLSEINIKIAFVFMIIVLILGPTQYILKLFSNSLGLYVNRFIQSSLFISTENTSWQADWTIFYLAWWISWSPFVGTFIARISKGRTIREFILAVMIIPSLLSFVWMSVFGGASFYVNNNSHGALFEVVQNDLPVALFELINLINIPVLSVIIKLMLSFIGTVLIISFFVTSSDSGSLVVDSITSGGKIDAPVNQRVFWACMEGFVAVILLLIGGEKALSALQTAVISTGLPFVIILIIISFLLVRSIQTTYTKQLKIKQKNRFDKLMKTHLENKREKNN